MYSTCLHIYHSHVMPSIPQKKRFVKSLAGLCSATKKKEQGNSRSLATFCSCLLFWFAHRAAGIGLFVPLQRSSFQIPMDLTNWAWENVFLIPNLVVTLCTQESRQESQPILCDILFLTGGSVLLQKGTGRNYLQTQNKFVVKFNVKRKKESLVSASGQQKNKAFPQCDTIYLMN